MFIGAFTLASKMVQTRYDPNVFFLVSFKSDIALIKV